MSIAPGGRIVRPTALDASVECAAVCTVGLSAPVPARRRGRALGVVGCDTAVDATTQGCSWARPEGDV